MNAVFFDANVVLDLVDPHRSGHSLASMVFTHAAKLGAKRACSWHTLSIVDYLMGRKLNREGLQMLLEKTVDRFDIPATGKIEAQLAFRFLSDDYEDAMQISAAVTSNASVILTNDRGGFEKSPVEVLTPQEFTDRGR